MRLQSLHLNAAPSAVKHRRRVTGASFLLLLLFGISLPASTALAKTKCLPVVKVLSHPALVSHSTQATFTFYSSHYDVDAYSCSLDRNAYKPCEPLKTYSGLKKGVHRFSVKAITDGMAGPAAHFTWVIKAPLDGTKAPTIGITSHPSLNTASTSAVFGVSSNKSKAKFFCVLDQAASTPSRRFSSCKPPVTYTGLAPGLHTFAIRASFGGVSSRPLTFAWIISAVAPANTIPPAITGTAQVGQTLTTNNGTWTGSLPISYSYQWQLCSSTAVVLGSPISTGPVYCSDIIGATSPSYIPEGEAVFSNQASSVRQLDFGRFYYTLRVVVTATNAAGQAEAASSQTSPVLPAAPVNTALPLISVGSPPATGTTASTDSYPSGSWLNYPYDYSFQWQRCDASGGNCVDIAGATSYSYVLQDPDDIGSTLRVVVTATNDGGSTSATSLPTAVIVLAT